MLLVNIWPSPFLHLSNEKQNVFFVKFTAELVSFFFFCVFFDAFIQWTSCIKEPMYIKFLYKNKKEQKHVFFLAKTWLMLVLSLKS